MSGVPDHPQPASPPLPAERPENLHKRVTTSAEDEEYEPLVEGLGGGCAKLYAQLEECMGENDRDWTKCQKEVAALKACYVRAHPGQHVQ